MTFSACEQWADFADRDALGEPLSQSERALAEKHLKKCAACRAESRSWVVLADALSDSGALERGLLPAENPAGIRHFAKRILSKRSMLGGAFAAAAAVAAVFLWSGDGPPASRALLPSRVAFSAVSGDVLVGTRHASAGLYPSASEPIRVQRGGACLAFEPGISACLGEASDASVQSQDLSQGVNLRVGRVVAKLERQAPGRTFSIMTPRGAVVAKGTVFSVEVAGTGEVTVRVHEGTVLVEQPGRRKEALTAPGQGTINERFERGVLSHEGAARDASLIAIATLLSRAATSRLDVNATPAGARVTLDNVELGRAPVSALVSGNRRLTVEHPGYAPVSERLWLEESSSLSRNYELVPLNAVEQAAALGRAESSIATAEPNAAFDTSARASAAELLTRARTLRRGGRYREAAAAYRKLFSTYPKSAEARASLVSLGELQLGELGEPKGALESFDAYLRGAGALSQEARYGRIRALARLGRKDDERRAIEQFLKAYPRSVQASSLRARQTP